MKSAPEQPAVQQQAVGRVPMAAVQQQAAIPDVKPGVSAVASKGAQKVAVQPPKSAATNIAPPVPAATIPTSVPSATTIPPPVPASSVPAANIPTPVPTATGIPATRIPTPVPTATSVPPPVVVVTQSQADTTTDEKQLTVQPKYVAAMMPWLAYTVYWVYRTFYS